MEKAEFEGKSHDYKKGYIAGLLAVASAVPMHVMALMCGETPESLKAVALAEIKSDTADGLQGFADGIEDGCKEIQKKLVGRTSGNEAYEHWLATA